MVSRFKKLFVIVEKMALILLFLYGCARPMAINHKTKDINIAKESIALMSFRTSNKYKPRAQPIVEIIEVTHTEQNKDSSFKVTTPHKIAKNQYNEHLISMQLPPGNYKIGDVSGVGHIPPLGITGSFDFPLNVYFKLEPNSITYIGHAEMINRVRKKGEERSGGVFPLVDQISTGFSGGTFDINVSDRYDEDIKSFKETFPIINDYEIKKGTLRK